MSLLSMKEGPKDEDKFFDILKSRYTYTAIVFTIINFLVAVFYFLYVWLAILPAIVLSLVYIGVPLFNTIQNFIWRIPSIERSLFNRFTNHDLPAIRAKRVQSRYSHAEYMDAIRDIRTWKLIGFMALKLPISAVMLIPSLVFFVLTYLLGYTPVNSVFGKINILGLFETESFIEILFVFFASIILWISILHFIQLINKWMERFTIMMICR